MLNLEPALTQFLKKYIKKAFNYPEPIELELNNFNIKDMKITLFCY